MKPFIEYSRMWGHELSNHVFYPTHMEVAHGPLAVLQHHQHELRPI